MVETTSPSSRPVPPPAIRRRLPFLVAGVVVAAALIVIGIVLVGHWVSGRPEPNFPSLAQNPDSSLQGTVAYFAPKSRCVTVVAASGSPSKPVLCLSPPDMSKAAQLGTKEDSPQLVWLPDGRLQVTMFRVNPKNGTTFPGWQKTVNVRTGQTQDTPATEVPSTPNLTTRPTVSPSGERITTSSDPRSGRIKIMLSDATGTRTLLSAQGPGEYTYGLNSAFWAPNWKWIAADDGRILIVTPEQPSTTRLLTDETKGGGALINDAKFASFAVTESNLLSPAK